MTDTLAQLEERVRSGDDTVTPEQIEQARVMGRFATLRQEAADRRAAAEREQQEAAEREKAFAEARKILAEVTDTDVAAAEQAAGEAMTRLRETVRARNDAQDRAWKVLQACRAVAPRDRQVGHIRGEPRPVYPELGYGWDNGRPLLWVGGRSLPRLDEDALLDRARTAPADADSRAQKAANEAARARRIAQDAALYRSDPRAFEELPAVRRKPALESLGVDWSRYLGDPNRPRVDSNRL
ncbi:hypothetical protein G3I30_02620 [Actinospica acidiphila]|nr:hypothetical protein [Actinospica acidiphila]